MRAYCEFCGPDGALWFSLADCTTRQVGAYVVNSATPALPRLGPPNHEYFIDFYCPPTTAPWWYFAADNNAYAVGSVSRVNSTTARLAFNLGYNGASFPPGEVVTIRYGWGAQ